MTEYILRARRWLKDYEFKELLKIADYIGYFKNEGSLFKINIRKVVNNRYSYDDVINLINEYGLEFKGDYDKLREEIEKYFKITITYDNIIGELLVKIPWNIWNDLKEQLKETFLGDLKYRSKDADGITYALKPYRLFELNEFITVRGYRINDELGLLKPKEIPYDFSFTGALRPYQEEALNSWKERKYQGVIALPTGSGKTVIAIAALSMLKRRTLIVTYTKEQMFQWKDMILRFTDIKDHLIGFFYAEEKRLSPITITTYQSAYKNIGVLSRYYDFLIIDECLAGDTLIVMEDGGVKEIQELRDGEKVLGGIVSNKFSKKSDRIYYIRTDFSELLATDTHPHLVLRKGKELDTDNLEIIRTRDLVLGDYLLVPEKIPHKTKNNMPEHYLELIALILCNGTIDQSNGQVVVRVKREDISWVNKIITEIKVKQSLDIIIRSKDDNEYMITIRSKELVNKIKKIIKILPSKKYNYDISNEVFYAPLNSIKAFIETCFSCKGTIIRDNGNVFRLCFTHNSKKLLLKLQLLLKKFGLHAKLYAGRENEECSICLEDEDFNKALDIFSFDKKSLNVKIRNNVSKNNKIGMYRLARILEIKEYNKPMVVYDFTSNGTHTFIANGILTHNCHHLPADKFRIIAMYSIAPYRMGLSATPIREDGRHTDLFPLLGGIAYYKSVSELTEQGYLAKFKVYTVRVRLSSEEEREYQRLYRMYKALAGNKSFLELLEEAKRGDKNAQEALKIHSKIRLLLANSISRLKKAAEIATKEYEKGSKVIVFTQYIVQAKELSRILNAYLLTGEMDSLTRRNVLEKFKKASKGILVVTTVGDEGIDIPDANVGIIVSGTGSRRQFIQRLGRLLRPKGSSEARLYEIVIKGTAEEYASRKRKSILLDDIDSLFQ